eukprot:Clim_evm56s243 gene=Clim_evmTU56s243
MMKKLVSSTFASLMALAALQVNAERVFVDSKCIVVKDYTWGTYEGQERFFHEPNTEMEIWQTSFANMPVEVMGIPNVVDWEWEVFNDDEWHHGKFSCILMWLYDSNTLTDDQVTYIKNYAKKYGARILYLDAYYGNPFEGEGIIYPKNEDSPYLGSHGVPTSDGMKLNKLNLLDPTKKIPLDGFYGGAVQLNSTVSGNIPYLVDSEQPDQVYAYYHETDGVQTLISYIPSPIWEEGGNIYGTYLIDFVLNGLYFGRRDYSRYMETMNTENLPNVWPEPLGLWYSNGKYGDLNVTSIISYLKDPPLFCEDDSLDNRAKRRLWEPYFANNTAQLIQDKPCATCDPDNFIFYSSKTLSYPISGTEEYVVDVATRFPNASEVIKCGQEYTTWVTATHLEKGQTEGHAMPNPPLPVKVQNPGDCSLNEYTKSATGGSCYWEKDPSNNCAVCEDNGCACGAENPHLCLECGAANCNSAVACVPTKS